MSKSKVFFILCLAFIFGIALHSLIATEKRIVEPFQWYLGFLICGVFSIVILSGGRRPESKDLTARFWVGLRFINKLGMTLAVIALIFLGFFRYAQAIPISDARHILSYIDQKVTVRGVIDAFPRFRENSAAYVIKVQNINQPNFPSPLEGEGRVRGAGKLLLTTELFPRYDFGEELTFVCAPARLNQYEQYARREGVSASCAFPRQIFSYEKIKRASLRNTLYQIRQSFHARLNSLFPDPYGGLLAGLLYGDTSGFSRELKDAFRITGISHITALSGYNITILAHLLISMLITFWLTRKQALPVAFALIIAFVVLTGAEASVVRASVMGFLLMGAKGVGRSTQVIGRKSPMRIALIFAGAVMLWVNPSLLRFDLGFQLSFLATIALLWFSRDIETRTWIKFLPKPFQIREAAAASFAAILFTAPLILYVTGMIGPLALLVNILVVPVVPFAMAFGFVGVAGSFVVQEVGMVIAWLARVLLAYIISIAEYFARFGALHWQVSIWSAAVLMGAIVFWIWWWKKKIPRHITHNP